MHMTPHPPLKNTHHKNRLKKTTNAWLNYLSEDSEFTKGFGSCNTAIDVGWSGAISWIQYIRGYSLVLTKNQDFIKLKLT